MTARQNVRQVRQTRPFTLDIGDPADPHWSSLSPIGIKALQGVSFGFAEETVGLIEYVDGWFRVGIGESLRPFIEAYFGQDAEEASSVFFKEVLSRAFDLAVR